ncbi:flavin reductase family protein [Sphingomonas psychrotolerans]|uniref:Flavin reductase family protein n=1 Tax=Sphingomonas psychrotolerans TaxID=1327635 RepID=A0ABU3N6P0_9SPHN|nr:flavin reductase family protein [Sphingomonas psychrotolerans]MDT8760195.1 flavin reductase family protein [Sphingomonas psychrotolerans]
MRDVAEQLRAGLRRLGKAVVVITCRYEERRWAMTATAVSELSMDPPSLLVCVNKSASLHGPLTAGANFCVNILHADHLHVSQACSGKAKGEARFAEGAWDMAADGTPYLRDAQASFFCTYERHLEYGTHAVVIGAVTGVSHSGEVDPLIYIDGGYARAARFA